MNLFLLFMIIKFSFPGLFGDRENKIKSKEKRKTLETCDSDDGKHFICIYSYDSP